VCHMFEPGLFTKDKNARVSNENKKTRWTGVGVFIVVFASSPSPPLRVSRRRYYH
jgi:hypothetical protein